MIGGTSAWRQAIDPNGFAAPFGLTTAERRHPRFRTHGVGKCEWDGAVWPFATSQTLTAMANVLRNDPHSGLSGQDYMEVLLTHARAQHKQGRPYIGEYQDEKTGEWLKGDDPRGRSYNHSTFCDLVIAGLVGVCPQADDNLIVHPLVPQGTWEWFALDQVPYHGRTVTLLWDRTGERYGRGPGLSVFVDSTRVARAATLTRVVAPLPPG